MLPAGGAPAGAALVFGYRFLRHQLHVCPAACAVPGAGAGRGGVKVPLHFTKTFPAKPGTAPHALLRSMVAQGGGDADAAAVRFAVFLRPAEEEGGALTELASGAVDLNEAILDEGRDVLHHRLDLFPGDDNGGGGGGQRACHVLLSIEAYQALNYMLYESGEY